MRRVDDYVFEEGFDDDEVDGDYEVYVPETFAEYARISDMVEEIYSTHENLMGGLYDLIGQFSLFEAGEMPDFTNTQEDPIPYTPDTGHPLNQPYGKNAYGKDTKATKADMLPISREPILWGTKVRKALMQVPFSAQKGVLERTLFSTDPGSSHYVGEGLNGALKHREQTGQPLSNYTCELRFLRTGKPQPYIFDPTTNKMIPNLGAVLSPGRAAIVAASKGGPVPNPHKGYQYDGKDDDGKVLFNGKGGEAGPEQMGPDGTPRLRRTDNMAKGVFLPYKELASMETPVNAPVQGTASKRGKVGTSLQPPAPGEPMSYTHYQDPKTGTWIRSNSPGSSGHMVTASATGGRRYHDLQTPSDKDQEFGEMPSQKDSGGAQTIDKEWRKYLQAQSDQPGSFNQRLQRYLLYRQRMLDAGKDKFKDREGNEIRRRDTGVPLDHTPGTWMTHAPQVDKNGDARSRQKRWDIPGTDRQMVEPARRVPMSDGQKQAWLDAARTSDQYFQNMIAFNRALGTAEGEQKAKDAEAAWKVQDEKYLRGWRIMQGIGTKFSQSPPKGPLKTDFEIGQEREKTGERYPEGDKRGPKPKQGKKLGDEISAPKRTTGFDKKGNEISTAVKNKTNLMARKVILPNLYDLSPVIDESKPVLISKKLADEIRRRQVPGVDASQVLLRDGDGSPSDKVIMDNYGFHRKGQPGAVYTVGREDGGRFRVQVTDKSLGGKECYFAKTEDGAVVFRYTPNKEEHVQPILSPGRLNKWMGGNPTVLGGHVGAPGNSHEKIPYEDQERTNNSLYGPPGPDGKWNTNQPANSPNTKGWSGMIEVAIKDGINIYLNSSKMDELPTDTQEELKTPAARIAFASAAMILAMHNLKNGKFMDTSEGHDVYFNLEYMHRMFPHLYATVRKLDAIVDSAGTSDNPAIQQLLRISQKPPSQMTMVEFKTWLDNPVVRQALDQKPLNIKLKTKNLTYKPAVDGNYDKTVSSSYKDAYKGRRIIRQYGRDGKPLADPDNIEAAKRGRTVLRVSVPQIQQMVDDARELYCKWIGKDIVRKAVNAMSAKKSRTLDTLMGKGGGGDVETGYERATKESQEAARAQLAMTSGKGYTRFRGIADEYFAEKRKAPAILAKEYALAEREYASNPGSVEATLRMVGVAVKRGQSLIDLHAFRQLSGWVKREPFNPDLNEPWTDDNTKIYIVKHLPEWIKKESKGGINPEVLQAASDFSERHTRNTSEQIMNKAKTYAGDQVNNKEAKDVGYWLAAPGEKVTGKQKSDAVRFAFAINRGKYVDFEGGEPEDIDENTAASIEYAISYHAIETFLHAMEDNVYSENEIANIQKIASNLKSRSVLPQFTTVVLEMLSDYHTSGRGIRKS